MKPKPFRTFKINGGCYDFDVHCCISRDEKKVIRYVNSILGLPSANNIAVKEDSLKCLGKIFHRWGYCPVVWIPSIPRTPRQHATVVHELFHATCQVMKWVEIPLDDSSEEAYTHLISHLIGQFYSKMK